MTQEQQTLSSLHNTFTSHSLHSLIKPELQLQSHHISSKHLEISNIVKALVIGKQKLKIEFLTKADWRFRKLDKSSLCLPQTN